MRATKILRPLVIWSLALPFSVDAQAQPEAAPRFLGSWTSDAVALREGDVVTILVDEQTLASADRNESTARDRDRDVGLSAALGSRSGGGSLRTQNDVSDRTRGDTSRRERFTAEISAVVTELLPNGVARIEGTKRLQIDDHEQEVTIRGIIRSQDLAADNTIESWRVASAELSYDSNDELAKAGGFWSRLFDLIIP